MFANPRGSLVAKTRGFRRVLGVEDSSNNWVKWYKVVRFGQKRSILDNPRKKAKSLKMLTYDVL
jgi:hypothetical protein